MHTYLLKELNKGTAATPKNRGKKIKKVIFKKLFINNTKVDNTTDNDVVMPMHNLKEYSKLFEKIGKLMAIL